MQKSKTPIADFVKNYEASGMTRFHMPGHKGRTFLGCESLDITEIKGADSLYEAAGIIAESERNATELFGSKATFYSTEGSSQCIRAMLYLALLNYEKKNGRRPVIAAARNVHKAFVYAAALLDFDVQWLWPAESQNSLCSCPITAENLESTLDDNSEGIVAVYLTSPDYLGQMADIKAIAEVCHKRNILLLIDNAHGAYLHYLEKPLHPLDLGADMCCDSAHKTFPVLTGGAYLHLNKTISEETVRQAKYALELFGSTSPSYLTMASLDLCNEYLSQGYRERLAEAVKKIDKIRENLRENGWQIEKTDPFRITFSMPEGLSGEQFAGQLRDQGIECEYADQEYLVLMVTLENSDKDYEKLLKAAGKNERVYRSFPNLPAAKAVQKMSVREAMFTRSEIVAAKDAVGRICRTPTVSCPPAIPVAVPGECIEQNAADIFLYYGIEFVDVVG